jgi:hypothetical protein
MNFNFQFGFSFICFTTPKYTHPFDTSRQMRISHFYVVRISIFSDLKYLSRNQ